MNETGAPAPSEPSINLLAMPLVANLAAASAALRLGLSKSSGGATPSRAYTEFRSPKVSQ